MKNNLWFSYTAKRKCYNRGEPAFIKGEDFSWASDFAMHYKVIKNELEAYTKSHELKSYFNRKLVPKENSWKTIALKVWGIEKYKTQKHFPKTSSIFNKYSEILSVSFSLLEANSTIHKHRGDTNGIYRCHFGISIPSGLSACGFEVKEQQQAWKEGEWLIFIDAHLHWAWNNTDQQRVIMIVDVVRPEFANKKGYIASTVLMALIFQRFPKPIRVVLAPFSIILRLFVVIGIFFSNLIKLF